MDVSFVLSQDSGLAGVEPSRGKEQRPGLALGSYEWKEGGQRGLSWGGLLGLRLGALAIPCCCAGAGVGDCKFRHLAACRRRLGGWCLVLH